MGGTAQTQNTTHNSVSLLVTVVLHGSASTVEEEEEFNEAIAKFERSSKGRGEKKSLIVYCYRSFDH